MRNNTWHIYIVRCSDNSLYTGIATDVEQRIQRHNAGTGAKYTKGRGPVVEIYREKADNRSQASKREYAIKQMTKKDKLALAEHNT